MTTISSLMHDLLNEQSTDLDEVLDRHLAAGYRQRTDGAWSDRAAVAEHFVHLRKIAEGGRISVLDELVDGPRYAERHIVEVAKRDGRSVTQEVYVFGRLDGDGRFESVEEATMMLAGAEADRGIGSARG